MKKKSGPKTDPYGTPVLTFFTFCRTTLVLLMQKGFN